MPFLFEDRNEVRTIRDELGNIWFVAKDIILALDYSKFDSNLISKIPDEWKDTKPIRTLGGDQNMAIISEQGLYFFIGRSDKPKALPFQKWIAGEVLPSIRKTGNYSIQPKTENLQKPDFPALTNELNDYEIYSNKLLGFIENLRNRNQIDLFRFDKIMFEQFGKSPLAHFEIDLESQFFLPTELGKMINKSAVEINLMIANRGFQVRENGIWKITESGREFGIEINGQFSQIKWKMKSII